MLQVMKNVPLEAFKEKSLLDPAMIGHVQYMLLEILEK